MANGKVPPHLDGARLDFSGAMSYGEFFVPGETQDEVLITCHVCHPSLANDNLSGIAVATAQ